MNNAPVFHESFLGLQKSKLNIDYWPTVLDIFDKGDYVEAVRATLRYIDGEVLEKTGNKDLTEFSIPHGSLNINLSIKDGKFSVSTPFLKIPEKNVLPLMRQVAEINFNILVLAQIILKGNELSFEYSCPIELTDPYKVFGLLREICNNADYYDDIFVEKFEASHLGEMRVKKFDSQQIDLAWEKYQEYLKEGLDYLDYFEGKRLYGFGWDMLYMAFMKIDYFMNPQGFLRSEIEKAIADMNAQSQINEVLSKAKGSVKKFQEYDKAKFANYMYIAEIFISPKTRADLTAVQNNLQKIYEGAKNEIGGSDHTAATLSLLYGIYNLFYRHNIPVDIGDILIEGLKNSSQKPWKEAAEALWKSVSTIMEMKNGAVAAQQA